MATKTDVFYFNWTGKSNLRKVIQAPACGVLNPDMEKSVDFDKTENAVIVGDNLDALKILRETYANKIKMIYIDPPYNARSNTFIYRNDFKEPLENYLKETKQIDNNSKKPNIDIEIDGRYHSAWLNFIYPRLFLARDLLRDDGIIFVSIDDREVHHLRMIMDEIFREKNFVCTFICKTVTNPSVFKKNIGKQHDYIICFSKNINKVKINNENKKLKGFNHKDEYANERGKYKLKNLDRGNLHYFEKMDYPLTAPDGSILYPGGNPADKQNIWSWSKEKVKWGIKNGFIIFKKDKKGNWKVYMKKYEFVDNKGKQIKREYPYSTLILDKYNQSDGTNVNSMFDIQVFEYPKSVRLIKHLLKIGSDKDSIILDFFAGSGTTGHAVWDINREDKGNRKFILVQLDEEVKDENVKKQFPTIADICIERLRKVSEKYKKEDKSKLINNEQDLGFKVFKIGK